MTTSVDRARAAILGAHVGDAATMGFHWLYDQARIAALAGAVPEFRAPNAADFMGEDGKGLGYFAHGGKRVGQPSHYGAQMRAMCTSLTRKGTYDAEDYALSFREAFGYGGHWVGYIDRPTRATLNAMAAAEAAEKPTTRCGADDGQLPAVSKLPPLVARHHGEEGLAGMVESAVRLTNDRDDSVAWGHAVSAMISAAISGAAPEDCVAAARGSDSMIDGQIEAALARRSETPEEVATAFALHCQLEKAFPVMVHLIATAKTYPEAMRANIRAGGDNCGRSIPVGAVLGASFAGDEAAGLPASWLALTTVPGDVIGVI
ncbi:MAG: ADP-ribosylglycohydrolase family protein [Pseudomonadota bacterium]